MDAAAASAHAAGPVDVPAARHTVLVEAGPASPAACVCVGVGWVGRGVDGLTARRRRGVSVGDGSVRGRLWGGCRHGGIQWVHMSAAPGGSVVAVARGDHGCAVVPVFVAGAGGGDSGAVQAGHADGGRAGGVRAAGAVLVRDAVPPAPLPGGVGGMDGVPASGQAHACVWDHDAGCVSAWAGCVWTGCTHIILYV